MCSSCCHSVLTKAISFVDHAAFYADPVLDCVPGVSTVTNGVHLVEKIALKTLLCCGCLRKTTLNKSLAYNSIRHKSVGRCVLLMIPIVGQGIVGFYTAVTWNKFCEKRQYLKDLANPKRADHAKLYEVKDRLKKLHLQVNKVINAKKNIDRTMQFQEKFNGGQNWLANRLGVQNEAALNTVQEIQAQFQNASKTGYENLINKEKDKCQTILDNLREEVEKIESNIGASSEKTVAKIAAVKKKIDKLEGKLQRVDFGNEALPSEDE